MNEPTSHLSEVASDSNFNEVEYIEFLNRIKVRIQEGRIRAALSANTEVILMYWDIGSDILNRQQNEGWGSHVVKRLSRDIHREFPDAKGFSIRNLQYMRALAETYPDRAIAQQLVAQLPWGHILHLLHKVKDETAREWYIRQTVEHGWSRDILSLHTAQGDYERKGKAITNFSHTLPAPQSDLVQDILKDPYVFDFLGLTDDIRERELENALLQHLREFLIELGNGFAFIGNQYRLAIGDEDYYIDLLFYHLKLRCYFVIDLKTRPFAAEDAGKMNFYLNAVDDMLRHPDDKPSVGLVLCREKEGSNRMLLEYALRGLKKPIGVSEYQLTRALPNDLKSILPTVEEIEREIADTGIDDADNSNTGRLVREMQAKYGSTELAANLFRATQTEEKFRRDEVKGKPQANQTHYEVGKKVRQTIEELGGTMPENLPAAKESVKQVERKHQKRIEGEGTE